MKLYSHKIPTIFTFIMLLSIGAFTAILYIFPTSNTLTSALTYETQSNMSFTFSPMISISVSSNTIDIPTIVPGTTAESNPIIVTVSTNTAYGYSLYADAGSNDTDSTYYNTSDLMHNDSTVNNTFTSIATNASLTSLTTDNTWGYSTSNDNGATWSVYNGLPATTSTSSSTSTGNPALLIDTKDPADSSKSITFKVAARASTTQASGTYSNVINFYAVGKPRPYYMQEPESIKVMLKNIGDELQAIDQRDGKKYWVGKQADGNIWMTQNLDLCLGCEGTAILTSQNTDINTYGDNIYYKNYIENDGIITWSAPNATSNRIVNGLTVSPPLYPGNYMHDLSAEGGETYIYASNIANSDTVYNSLEECSINHSVDDCSHYHIGNYYNWSAAIASSDSSNFISQYFIASNSICPAGWRLPKGRAAAIQTAETNEFGELLRASEVTSSLTSSLYSDNGFIKMRTAPLYFVLGGDIYNASVYGRATSGRYWSSTSNSGHGADNLAIGNNQVLSAHNADSADGAPIRCLAR